MILSALTEYYEIMAKEGQIPKPGYSCIGVSFAVILSENGDLNNILPLKLSKSRGDNIVEAPIRLEVPELQIKRSKGICSNFLCDNSSYVLGIDNKGNPERTRQCFNAFKKLHHNVLDRVDSAVARAVLYFLDTWEPEKASDCETVLCNLDELIAGRNIVFYVSDYGYAQDDLAIRSAWESYHQSVEAVNLMQCLVTGEKGPIARLHPCIKGVKGGYPAGVSIVSFGAHAYESYGHDDQKGLNAPVSEYAAFAYTTALNHLIADTNHKETYDDITVIHWASTSDPIYSSIARYLMNPTKEILELDGELETVFHELMKCETVKGVNQIINWDTPFYVLGVSPNNTRLSVRFFLSENFGRFAANMKAHYDAINIECRPGDYEYLPLWKLMRETVSYKSKDKEISPLLAGAVMRSIFAGQPYPELLFRSVLMRIRTEKDISRGKAAVIKAYLLRRYSNEYKEFLKNSLNEELNKKAYLLGRLFAILEKAQQDTAPGISVSIKDKYLSLAFTRPVAVFPRLLQLANYYTIKAQYGYATKKKIRQLLKKLDYEKFPSYLSLQEQGEFILGYYHQMNANYTKRRVEEGRYGDSEQI